MKYIIDRVKHDTSTNKALFSVLNLCIDIQYIASTVVSKCHFSLETHLYK